MRSRTMGTEQLTRPAMTKALAALTLALSLAAAAAAAGSANPDDARPLAGAWLVELDMAQDEGRKVEVSRLYCLPEAVVGGIRLPEKPAREERSGLTCEPLEYRREGQRVDMVIECTGPRKVSVRMTHRNTLAAQRIDAVTQIGTSRGRRHSSGHTTLQATRVGDCEPDLPVAETWPPTSQ